MNFFKVNPLGRAAEQVMVYSEDVVLTTYTAVLHTEKQDFIMGKLLGMDITRDYTNTYTDKTVVEAVMGLGDFVRDVYPYRENLEMTVYEKRIGETNGSPLHKERFKCIILQEEDELINVINSVRKIHKKDLNVVNMYTLTVQLISTKFEPLIERAVHGVYNDISAEETVRVAIAPEIADYEVTNLDIYPADRTDILSQAVIPDGTPLLNVPRYVQKDLGGLYNAGLGSYLQSFKGQYIWFIFPLFATDRWDKNNVGKLVIMDIGPFLTESPAKSYKVSGSILQIVCTKATGFKDNDQGKGTSYNKGFKTINPFMSMIKPALVKPGDVEEILLNKRLNSIDVADNIPRDKLPMSGFSDKLPTITTNIHAASSEVMGSFGQRVDVIWENSMPGLLYPGMPVQYHFVESATSVRKVEGILLFHHNSIKKDGPGISATGHRCTTNLSIYVKDKLNDF